MKVLVEVAHQRRDREVLLDADDHHRERQQHGAPGHREVGDAATGAPENPPLEGAVEQQPPHAQTGLIRPRFWPATLPALNPEPDPKGCQAKDGKHEQVEDDE